MSLSLLVLTGGNLLFGEWLTVIRRKKTSASHSNNGKKKIGQSNIFIPY